MSTRTNKQLAFQTVLDDSFKAHEKRMISYMAANVEKYQGFAAFIMPKLSSKSDVYIRLAFSIISANAPFDDSCKALKLVIRDKGKVLARDLLVYAGMTANKANWVNTVYWECQRDHKQFLKASESWQAYRLRLSKQIKGLGLCKASFAACLLYPLEADIACVDTWIQKVFLGHMQFRQISIATYEQVESKIRSYARRFNINTFLAQWLIWDHARGSTNNHAIFPGSHK